ncbi:AmpG family muropeptide MFS transporter [Aliikangiella marina]|uniref:AmpG family muropeptide MFS transporter n=1 Tax=Aliikangiella marina TaxID=1712262 RepID=A0A545TE72_9GAMM|nr:MFS transporter [Aliikangiella marina]TQV75519.1 AmpG family muropeptide MFS transporter [Aliikangiella marina]
MLKDAAVEKNWKTTAQLLIKPQVLTMLFLGFSAGIPFSLIFSSLSLWLNEAGITKSMVTYFSWAGLAFSFKFLWAPLVDRIPVPFLTQWLGRRRGWLLTAQFMVIGSIIFMGSINPLSSEQALVIMALAAVALGFSAATQDIVIDAYRIEVADVSIQGVLSSTYFTGYRVAMIVSGAGALYLAGYLGSSKESYDYDAWQTTYYVMAAVMLIGIVTTLVIREPENLQPLKTQYTNAQYVRFLLFFAACVVVLIYSYLATAEMIANWKLAMSNFFGNKPLANFIGETSQLIFAAIGVIVFGFIINKVGLMERQLVRENYWLPVKDFFSRYGLKLSILLLVFVGFYRISDIVLGVIALVFYQDLGFTKAEIATVSKTFGVVMMIIGSFIGGIFSIRFGVIRVLMAGSILIILTNLLFMVLAHVGDDIAMLYLVISADNLAAGIATAAFLAFLASITNVSFTAVQYAIFSSLMTLIPKIIGGYSGSMVDNIGYSNFFLVASLMGVPVLYLIVLLNKHLTLKENGEVAKQSSK